MKRSLLIVVLTAISAGSVSADIAPPRPPAGFEDVPVGNEVLLGEGIVGYVFAIRYCQGPGTPRYSYERIELSKTQPFQMPDDKRHLHVSLVAIPESIARQIPLFETPSYQLAFKDPLNGVEGVRSTGFASSNLINQRAGVTSILRTHTIVAIDETGIRTTTTEQVNPKLQSRTTVTPIPWHTMVAGLTLSVSVGFLGVRWAQRRSLRQSVSADRT